MKILFSILFFLLAACGGREEPISAVKSALVEEAPRLDTEAGPKKELVYVEKLNPSLFPKKVKAPVAFRLRFQKTDKEEWTLLGGQGVLDNPSLLHPLEQSRYYVEVLSGEKITFQGGMDDPLHVLHELELKPGVWEHKEFNLQSSVFTIKIPANPFPTEIRFYKVKL